MGQRKKKLRHRETKPVHLLTIKVTLSGTDPPIWRRFTIPDNWAIGELHHVLQVVMGWDDQHLHIFKRGKFSYGPVGTFQARDEDTRSIAELLRREGDCAEYEYDMGDSWRHLLMVEKQEPLPEDFSHPVCLAGEKACPPEDIGGVWGYYQMLEEREAPPDPSDPDREELMEFFRGFDPAAFDPDKVTSILRAMCKRE